MTKYQDIIELNGTTYNLRNKNNQSTRISEMKKIPKIKPNDFTVPKPQTIIKPFTPEKPVTISKPPKHRDVGVNSSRHQLQKSSILMRKFVKKPKGSRKVTEITSAYSQNISHIRAGRANQAKLSPFIRKFNTDLAPLKTKIKHLPVTPTPVKNAKQQNSDVQIHQPIPQQSKADQLVNKTLQNIGSVSMAKVKKPKKHHKLKWGSAIIFVFVLASVLTYMNLLKINMKLASAQAGFSASVPGYKPDGYSLVKRINHQAGKIILDFKSNTDDRKYTVKQEVSNWNSQTLLDNVITSHNLAFTTSSENGLTIYLYDNGKATWVNGGIWYQIESNGLNSAQLTNIANSL